MGEKRSVQGLVASVSNRSFWPTVTAAVVIRPPNSIRLTREELGSYIGLKLEIVSRLFSRLQSEGIIQVQGHAMKLLDSAALGRMAGSTPDEAVGVPFPPQPLGAGSLPQVQSIWFTTGSTAWEQVVF